jgi:hypothetical protein
VRLLSLAALTALAGCASARLDAEQRVEATSQSYPVTGANPRTWDAPIAFGPYRTGPVRDGGTLGWSVEVLDLGAAGSRRPYAWTLTGPSGALDAECHQTDREASASGGTAGPSGATGNPVLACAFRAPGEESAGQPWRLTLTATSEGGYTGELRGGEADVAYRIRSMDSVRGSSAAALAPPAGWSLERGGGPAAVVEALGSGRVLLARAALDGEALAAAAAALLLFQPEPSIATRPATASGWSPP